MVRPGVARALGRFEIRGVIGAGAAGDVYEAWDRERDAVVALKTLRRLTGQSLYRFKAEFRSILEIQHPNLVRLGELLVEDDLWFFTMELVRGQTLREHLGLPRAVDAAVAPEETALFEPVEVDDEDQAAALAALQAMERPAPYVVDETRLRAVLPQIADVVHAIHERGKLHRDIKPANVVVEDTGRAVLMDFGLVHELAAANDAPVEFAGTPGYMAPEQARGIVGPPADWYAFGSMLYQALTGRLPFVAGTNRDLLRKKQAFEPPPPRALNSSAPADLDALCEELLRLDPVARPSGPAILGRLGVSPTPAVSPTPGLATSATPFVGRARELGVLREALDAMVRAGTAATVVVEGESGAGKSELVRRFIGDLEADAYDVVALRGRCYERESVPFKAFDGIVDALSRFLIARPSVAVNEFLPANAGLLTRLFPVLGRVSAMAEAPAETRDLEPRELRKRAFEALRELLGQIAARHRLVLVIDDLQWSDRESLALLGEILNPSRPIPLLLVVTARSDSPISVGTAPDCDLFVTELSRVQVGALEAEEARELIALLGGGDSGADALIDEAGGHPFFLVEMARHAATLKDAGTGDRIMRLDDALWSRAQALDDAARGLLELLAVAGAPLSGQVVRHALRAGYAEFDKAAAMLRAQLLARSNAAREDDALETYHDRVRQAISERLDARRTRAVHASLADAMRAHPEGVDATALVFHLEGAGRLQEAAEQAELAGETAGEAFAYGKAAELFETALRLGTWPPERERALVVAQAHALTNAGRSYAGADLFLRAAASTDDDDERLRLRLLGAEQLLISGRIDEGLEAMAAVQESVGIAHRRTRFGALVALLWNRVRLRLRGMRWAPRRADALAEADLRRFDVLKACADNLGLVDPVRGAEFQSRGLLLALDLGEPVRVGRTLAVEATFLAAQGQRTRDRSRKVIARARQLSDETGDPHLEALTSTVSGVIDYFDSNLEPAVATLERGERLFRDVPGEVWGFNGARMFLMFALRVKGEVGKLGTCYDEFVRDADARGDNYLSTVTRWSGAIVWLARDDLDRARAELARVRWAPPDRTVHLQHYYEIEALIDLALYEGRSEGVGELERRLVSLSRSMLTRVQMTRCLSRWLRGRLALYEAAAGRDPRARLRVVRAQATRLEQEGVAHATLWATLLRAGVQNQVGHAQRAVELLRSAESQCRRGGYQSLLGAVQLRLAELAAGPSAPALADAGRAVLRAEGVARPERFAALLTPGCGAAQAQLPKGS